MQFALNLTLSQNTATKRAKEQDRPSKPTGTVEQTNPERDGSADNEHKTTRGSLTRPHIADAELIDGTDCPRRSGSQVVHCRRKLGER